MSGAGVTSIPKGLHHLEVLNKSKFAGKWPSRLPHGPTQFIQPSDRIRRWNVRPQDKVRLLVGRPQEKFLDETVGAKSGWRVYTVKRVDLERNKVYVEGLNNKRSATARPKPENFNSLSEAERNQWETSANIAPMARPVHYSNVQLCVEDKNGPDSVFASRVATSTPYFNKGLRRLEWDRYAAKLTGPSDQAPDPERGLVRIPWPASALVKPADPTHLDTSSPSTSTLKLPSTDSLMTATLMGELLPSSSLEPIRNTPEAREWLDAHAESPGVPETDSTMPLFLSEELSPRFSRSKKTAGFNARREQIARDREEAGKAAVAAWEAGGRDRSLADVLGGEGAEALEGVKLRGRTRAEVREAAQVLFDQEEARVKRGVREAKKMEMRWSKEEGEWVAGERVENVERRKERRALKEKKVEKRMEGLRLEQGRNAVVPESFRA